MRGDVEINLRPLKQDDFNFFYSMERDSQVVKGTRARFPQTEEACRIRFDKLMALQEKSISFWVGEAFDDVAIPTDFHKLAWGMLLERDGQVELGYMLPTQFWGKGFATKFVLKLIEIKKSKDAAEDRKNEIRPLVALVDSENKASQRVLEKTGFQLKEQKLLFDTVLQKEVLTGLYEFSQSAARFCPKT